MGLASRPWLPTAVALALLAAAAALRYEGFLSARVLVDLLDDAAVLGLAALGSMIVISSGGIDLSPGAVIALASVVAASMIEAGAPPATAFAATTAGAALLGAFNGWLIHALRLPPFIVTLAALFLARGLALAVHVESLPIRSASWGGWSRLELPLAGLDVAAVTWLAFALLVAAAYRHTRTLRHALALGGDERTAHVFGVPMLRTRVAIYALAGACSGLAGAAYVLYSGKGDSTACVGFELDVIAAVVIGGTALRGGRASVIGCVLGVLLLGVLQTALIFEGVPGAGWTRAVLGGLLLVFLLAQRSLRRALAHSD
jgi:simple sugar transport system permease protein